MKANLSSSKPRVAFVDDQLYAREFRTNDVVRKTGLRDFVLTPYVGRVLYSNHDTGVVSVQWPWGQELNSPTELVKDKSGDWSPPEKLDQAYSTWESTRWTADDDIIKKDAQWRKKLASSLVDEFEKLTLPVYKAACNAWYHQIPEVDAISRISSHFERDFGFDVVRRTVGNLYAQGRRIAIQWNKSSHKYQISQEEEETGQYGCPNCGTMMDSSLHPHILQCGACGAGFNRSTLVLK
jgi:hypothetical protein